MGILWQIFCVYSFCPRRSWKGAKYEEGTSVNKDNLDSTHPISQQYVAFKTWDSTILDLCKHPGCIHNRCPSPNRYIRQPCPINTQYTPARQRLSFLPKAKPQQGIYLLQNWWCSSYVSDMPDPDSLKLRCLMTAWASVSWKVSRVWKMETPTAKWLCSVYGSYPFKNNSNKYIQINRCKCRWSNIVLLLYFHFLPLLLYSIKCKMLSSAWHT